MQFALIGRVGICSKEYKKKEKKEAFELKHFVDLFIFLLFQTS